VKIRNLPLLIIFATSAALIGCKPTASTSGSADPGNRGRTADTAFSSITGTNGTSVTPSVVTITLLSKGGAPLTGITPSFTVTPLNGEFAFQCSPSDLNGKSTCSFRSWDHGVTKTLEITSPISKSGGSVIFTQAASQIVITTQPDGSVAGEATPALADIETPPRIELRDPRNAIVTGDNSTQVTVAINTVSNTNLLGASPSLRKATVSCSPCTFTANAGVVNFGLAANLLSLTTSGTYKLDFSGSGLTGITSSEFKIENGAANRLLMTTQPSASVSPLQNFPVQPVVKILDGAGNLVTSGGCENQVVTMSKTSGAGTLLGTLTKNLDAGVSDFVNNALRIDTTAGAANYIIQAAVTSGGAGCTGVTVASSNAFTVTNVGIPNKLKFSVQPSTSTTDTVNLTRQPVVQVLDSLNSLVTNNNTIQVTLDATGCPGVTLTGGGPVTVSNGVATFSAVNLDAAATPTNCQIRATATGLTSAYSENVRIEAAGTLAQRIRFGAGASASNLYPILSAGRTSVIQMDTDPTGTVTAGAITLRIEDALGNLIASDFSTNVTLSKSVATGTLSGSVTKQAVSGIVTFTDLKIDTVGAYFFNATAPGLTSAASNSFVITNAGIPSALRIAAADQPTAITAGTIFPSGPVVRIKDELGNQMAEVASGIQVTLACTNPTGCILKGFPLTVTSVDGVADFNIAGQHTLRIDSPMGNNIVLTATSPGLASGSTEAAIVGSAGAISNATSTIAATAPSAINVNNGIVYCSLKDQYGNAISGQTPALTFAPANCSFTCAPSDANGLASCSFSCTATGNYTVRGTAGGIFDRTANFPL
jgi:hypothetical protein